MLAIAHEKHVNHLMTIIWILICTFFCAALKERPYAEDCRVYTPEKPNKFSNVYVGIRLVVLCKFYYVLSSLFIHRLKVVLC
jgi:hypothetical protein